MQVQKRKALALAPSYPLLAICGFRKGGKSATSEYVGEYYYRHGYLILDLWASQDWENAYWPIADAFFVNWDFVPGNHELRLALFCQRKYNADWFSVSPHPTIPNQRVRNYRLSKPDPHTINVTSLDGKQTITFRLSENRRRVTVELAGMDTKEINPKLFKFVAEPDLSDKTRIRLPNPYRVGSEERTVGYPALIILPETTKVTEKHPLCVCGLAMDEHVPGFTECPLKNMPLLRFVPDTMAFREIVKLAMAENRVVIFNRGFYDIEEQGRAYGVVHSYITQIPQLVMRKVIPTNVSVCMLLRELATLVPRRMKTIRGQGVTEAKRVLQGFVKEARHFRTTMVVDFQLGDEILGEVINHDDTLIVKRSSKIHLPEKHRWLYDKVAELNASMDEGDDESYWPKLENLQPWESYILYSEGNPRFELKHTSMPKFKHKEPYDDWEYLANCKITFDEDAIARKKKGGKDGKPKTEAEQLRDRALSKIHELKQSNPDWDWPKLIKEAGLLDRKGKPATVDAGRMAYNRWRDDQQNIPGDPSKDEELV